MPPHFDLATQIGQAFEKPSFLEGRLADAWGGHGRLAGPYLRRRRGTPSRSCLDRADVRPSAATVLAMDEVFA
jgi:hypothetical protein